MADAKTKTICVNQKTLCSSQLWTIVCLSLAFWPVWAWYLARTFDKSDEPWGLVALATAVLFLVVGSRSAPTPGSADAGRAANPGSAGVPPASGILTDPNSIAGAAFLCAYVITYPFAPHLVQAILLVLTVWFFVVSKFASPSKPGLLGLLLLSLPLIPSLNFFFGYPLRIIVAAGTCMMLNNLGMSAVREGIMVTANGHLTAIDAPCSGISMLWAESYVVMLLACVFRLDLKCTSILSLLALLFIIAGNALRATTLITFDKLASVDAAHHLSAHHLSQLEPSVHIGAGLLVFSAVCGLTIMVASALSGRMVQKSRVQSQAPKMLFAHTPINFANALGPLCLAAALIPCIAHPTGSTVTSDTPPNWPTEINGNKVLSVNSLAEERVFAQDFPGQMKRFTDGTNSYFVRFVQRETRQLHPSSDCFKGLGYQIEPHPMFVAEDGSKWGSFEAVKSNSRYLILERIFDDSGFSSTDVSEWYWLACLGKTHGPWFDVTIAQPLCP